MSEPNDAPEPGESEWDEELQRLYESDSLAQELGIEIEFAPDELAPPVDYARIRAFVRRELSKHSAFEVSHLIAGYRSWHCAWKEILRGGHCE